MAKYVSYKNLSLQIKQEIVDWYSTHSGKSTRSRFNILIQTLNKVLDEFNIKKHSKGENVKLGCLEKYGVINPSQTQQYKDKIINRSKEQRDQIANKRKKTNLAKYGKEHILQTEFGQQHRKQTCIERFGEDNIFKTEEFDLKRRQTNQEKYGADFPMQTDTYKENYRKVCLEKYGVDNYFKTEAFRADRETQILDKISDEFKDVFYDRDASINFLKSNDLGVLELSEYFQVSWPTIQAWILRHDLFRYVKHCKSNYENIIAKSFPEFTTNKRTILGNGQELDFYCAEKNLAIEFNGDYWHCDLNKPDKNYHLNKSLLAQDSGIRLIHIYEHEWQNPSVRKILISMVNIALGKLDNKIYARNCEVREISNKEAKPFNEANHLQRHRNAQVTYGLFYKGELVQLMSFSKTKWNRNLKGDNDWEIIRGCPGSNNIVVGGVSKLFKHFIREYDPDSVFSYCDFNKFDGKGYEAIGMKFIGYTGPDKYLLLRNGQVVPRNPSKYKELKEKTIANIWGCGSKKYLWEKALNE